MLATSGEEEKSLSKDEEDQATCGQDEILHFSLLEKRVETFVALHHAAGHSL